MDEILRTRHDETNIDSWSNLEKNIPTKNDNFLQHLDLSNMNEMYFESNLAETLHSSTNTQNDNAKLTNINFNVDLGSANAIVVDNSHDVQGGNFVLHRPWLKFIT